MENITETILLVSLYSVRVVHQILIVPSRKFAVIFSQQLEEVNVGMQIQNVENVNVLPVGANIH